MGAGDAGPEDQAPGLRLSARPVLGTVVTGLLLLLASAVACDRPVEQIQPVEQTKEAVEQTREVVKPSLGPGRWHKLHSERGELSPERLERIEQLESIGYVSGSVPASVRGISVHDRDRAHSGLNFYTTGHGPEAVLMDMEGRELHRWRYPFEEVWPDHPRKNRRHTKWWRRATLFENGDVIAIFAGFGIIKVDKDSKLLWARKIGAHHDLEIMPNGDIYVLTRVPNLLPRIHPTHDVLEDFISVLGPDGIEKRSVSVLEAFERSKYAKPWRGRGDIFHTNSLRVLDGRLAHRAPAFKKGNVLLSIHALDQLAVVDLDRAEVVWTLERDFKGQHDARIVGDGHLLLFDNFGRKEQSSVLELDPVSGEQVWEYRGTPERPFYSFTCGTADRLVNGNTLIVESDQGRAFEVTPEQEIVWEFYNPFRAGENGEYIATLFDLRRLPPGFGESWLGAEVD